MEYYTPEQMRRHEVRPGMTGLAQVSGRNNLSWEEKFDLDVQYVNTQNLWLDFKIMFKTAEVMLKKKELTHRIKQWAQVVSLVPEIIVFK